MRRHTPSKKRQARAADEWWEDEKELQGRDVDGWMIEGCGEGRREQERSTVRVMPLSRSLRHKTAAGAGWHSNQMKGKAISWAGRQKRRQKHFLLRE